MRKILFIATLVFGISVFALAQADTKFSDSWKTFAPPGEEFSIEVPESFVLTRFPQNSEDSVRLYKTLSDKTYFFIASDKISGVFLSDMISSFAERNNANASDSTVGVFQGNEYSFADAEGFYQKILVINGKTRRYVFHAVSETKDNPDVERFFSSARLDRDLPEESKSSEKEANIKAQSEPTRNAENKNTGQGVGSGSGNGIGSGSGNTNQAKPPTPTNQTSALKILSKPRANYTDLARFYQITGTVPLRVTFLASGEIGSVEAIRKLPFGLTANAIAAARAIRFEPAMQDGNAYNVTKIVEYSFTIY